MGLCKTCHFPVANNGNQHPEGSCALKSHSDRKLKKARAEEKENIELMQPKRQKLERPARRML